MASQALVPFFVLRLDENDDIESTGIVNDENTNDISATGITDRIDRLTLNKWHTDEYINNPFYRRAKAVFTVPADLVSALTAYPILCRGASFDLCIDEDSENIMQAAYMSNISLTSPASMRRRNGTTFLSTEFYSPSPEDTASEISKRLAIRIDNTDSFTVGPSILGF
jgi:hypothetical protein